MRKLTTICAALILLGGVVGCGSSASHGTQSVPSQPTQNASGLAELGRCIAAWNAQGASENDKSEAKGDRQLKEDHEEPDGDVLVGVFWDGHCFVALAGPQGGSPEYVQDGEHFYNLILEVRPTGTPSSTLEYAETLKALATRLGALAARCPNAVVSRTGGDLEATGNSLPTINAGYSLTFPSGGSENCTTQTETTPTTSTPETTTETSPSSANSPPQTTTECTAYLTRPGKPAASAEKFHTTASCRQASQALLKCKPDDRVCEVEGLAWQCTGAIPGSETCRSGALIAQIAWARVIEG